MDIKTITTEFKLIFVELNSLIPLDTAMKVESAKVILEELGRYRRGESARESRQNGHTVINSDAPATDKQKEYMRNLKITFKDDINKGEAAKLIDAVTKKDGK